MTPEQVLGYILAQVGYTLKQLTDLKREEAIHFIATGQDDAYEGGFSQGFLEGRQAQNV